MTIYETEVSFYRIRGAVRDADVVLEMKDTRADVPHHMIYMSIAQAEAVITALQASIKKAKCFSPASYTDELDDD